MWNHCFDNNYIDYDWGWEGILLNKSEIQKHMPFLIYEDPPELCILKALSYSGAQASHCEVRKEYPHTPYKSTKMFEER